MQTLYLWICFFFVAFTFNWWLVLLIQHSNKSTILITSVHPAYANKFVRLNKYTYKYLHIFENVCLWKLFHVIRNVRQLLFQIGFCFLAAYFLLLYFTIKFFKFSFGFTFFFFCIFHLCITVYSSNVNWICVCAYLLCDSRISCRQK